MAIAQRSPWSSSAQAMPDTRRQETRGRELFRTPHSSISHDKPMSPVGASRERGRTAERLVSPRTDRIDRHTC